MAHKTLTHEELQDKGFKLAKEEFPTTEEWVKNWLIKFFHDNARHKSVFYGSSSFVDINDMLRNADTLTLSRCAIYVTDVVSQLSDDEEEEYHNITFHICYRCSDNMDAALVEAAKNGCLEAVNEFRKFLIISRKLGNKNVKTLTEIGPSQSGVEFLDGWHTMQVTLRYFKPFCPSPNWNMYL